MIIADAYWSTRGKEDEVGVANDGQFDHEVAIVDEVRQVGRLQLDRHVVRLALSKMLLE